MPPLITLTTDFGLDDWFVGTMKGVILALHPAARVVDITHGIAPGDIRAGAFALAAACRHFPRGTVHVAVVDPGVGSGRPGIAVAAGGWRFVGPDNGLLSLALRGLAIREIRRLEEPAWHLPVVSATFHGRDVFAPVAARLSRGLPLSRAGPAHAKIVQLDFPEPTRTAEGWRGAVVYVDRFGNGITNLAAGQLAPPPADVRVGGRRLGPLRACYAAMPPGVPLALIGSTGFLEVAVNGGSAERVLRVRVGTPVTVVHGAGPARGSRDRARPR